MASSPAKLTLVRIPRLATHSRGHRTDHHATSNADRMNELVESLDLHDATVVCQDWGGAISLWWATRHPDRVSGLFILNGRHLLRSAHHRLLRTRAFVEWETATCAC